MPNPILFDKLYQSLLGKFKEIFNTTFISFSSAGINVNIDESIEYINKIIDDTSSKEPEEMESSDYIILCVCYFVCALLARFDESTEEETEDGDENGN